MARLIEHTPEFLAQLKRHEGLRLEAYYCTGGKLTVGWGHNVEALPVEGVDKEGDRITSTQAALLLERDIYRVSRQLDKRLPWWRELTPPRQGVLANMAFQLGIEGLCGFAKALAAIEQENWLRASAEMLDSKWARKDSPNRAAELARQMQTNEWQDGRLPKGVRR